MSNASTLPWSQNWTKLFSVQRLISVRAELKHSVVDKAVDQWHRKLRTCVHDKGQHFEQLLHWIIVFGAKFSETVTFVTSLGAHSIVFVRRLSNEACDRNSHKITFSHLIVINIVDINIGAIFKPQHCYTVRKKLHGMHSRRLIGIFLQNTNATFHEVV